MAGVQRGERRSNKPLAYSFEGKSRCSESMTRRHVTSASRVTDNNPLIAPPPFPLQCTLAIAVVMCRDHVLIALMLSKRILNGLCAGKLCNLTLHLLVCRCSGLAHKSHMRETRPKKVSLARSDKTRPRGGGLTHKREALILIFRFYSLHISFQISSISIYDTRAVLKTRSFADSLPWDGRSSYF